MIDIPALLEEIKASPFRDIHIRAPHCGLVTFQEIREGDKVLGPSGRWKEIPGTPLATIERERNPKIIRSPEKGEIASINRELEGKFVYCGTELALIRHKLTRTEVQEIVLKKALHLFRAPERAKYYFTPEMDKKIRSSDPNTVHLHEGTEILIMSRMKRETPLAYAGPDGVIYAVYFTYNQNMDAGEPLLGICPKNLLPDVQEVIMRVQSEWRES